MRKLIALILCLFLTPVYGAGSKDFATDQQVNMTNISLASGENFTIAIWVLADTLPNRFAFSIGAAATNQGPHIGSHTQANWRFGIWGAGQADDDTGHETNVWHFLMGTHDGTDGRLYIDGILRATTAMAFTGTDGTGRLGTLNNLASDWDGRLSNPRVWSKALNANEAQIAYKCRNQPVQNLIGQWSLMNDNDNYEDISRLGNDGTCSTCPNNSQDGPPSSWCQD
ncbi:MAG: LamG domain-containing protein [Proteobacteria bacterium]|nr:LamG domain-containing protein [Pseudomonadota bacterium]